MAEAYKCDRCDKYGRWFDKDTMSGSIIKNSLKKGWYPDKIDLCESCSEELRSMLFNWWNKEQTDKFRSMIRRVL